MIIDGCDQSGESGDRVFKYDKFVIWESLYETKGTFCAIVKLWDSVFLWHIYVVDVVIN